MQTIVINKSKNNSNTHHGIRNEMGGYFGTADNRWSIKIVIQNEKNNLRFSGETGDFQVEVNSKIIETGKIENLR